VVSRGGMAQYGTSDAVTAAGRNTTSSTSPLVVQNPTSSLLIFAFINSATTLVCACLTAVCVLSGLGLAGYRRRKEHLLADRLCAASATYWSFEHDVERLLRFVVIIYGYWQIKSKRKVRDEWRANGDGDGQTLSRTG